MQWPTNKIEETDRAGKKKKKSVSINATALIIYMSVVLLGSKFQLQ